MKTTFVYIQEMPTQEQIKMLKKDLLNNDLIMGDLNLGLGLGLDLESFLRHPVWRVHFFHGKRGRGGLWATIMLLGDQL